jgi:hypothetical protein
MQHEMWKIHNKPWSNSLEGNYLEDKEIDKRIILKWIPKEQGEME